MDIKRGSVTPVDLTGQADGDYIRNDSGVYRPRTPERVIMDLLSVKGQWGIYDPTDLGRMGVTNSGSVGIASFRLRQLITGATANSTVRLNTSYSNAWMLNSILTTLNFSKPFMFRTNCGFSMDAVAAPNAKAWGLLGSPRDAAIADPAVKSIGYRVDAFALKGVVHNGAVLTVIDLTTTLTNNTTCVIDIYSDGAGNVYWYLNGVLKGSTALGPTGAITAGEDCLQYMIINVEADNNIHNIHAFAIYTGG